jgi:hypothetical protein
MKISELASAYEKLSAVLKKVKDGPFNKFHPPAMDEEMQVGAAFLWSYLRSLLTGSPKEAWTRDELLVLLDVIQSDHEFFLPDNLALIADALDEESSGEEP